MKDRLTKHLGDSIEYFLNFSDIDVMRPKVVVIDKTDNYTNSITLQFAITDDFKFSDPIVIANEVFFENDCFEITLCHELGHIIDFSRKPYSPSKKFLKILVAEISADREGYLIYVRSGRNNRIYYKLFLNIYNEQIRYIIHDKNINSFRKNIKLIIINTMRFMAFIVYKHAY